MRDPAFAVATISIAINCILAGALISAFFLWRRDHRCPLADDGIHGDVPRLPADWPGKRNVHALRPERAVRA